MKAHSSLPPGALVALKQHHPLEEVVAGYGIGLRRSGNHSIGRCPFHPDQAHPNLVIYPRSGRFICFRCGAKGDVIDFVRLMDHLPFKEALAHLQGGIPVRPTPAARPEVAAEAALFPPRYPLPLAQQLLLSVALTLYHQELLESSEAQDYLQRRGISLETARRSCLGYALGRELASYLQAHRFAVEESRRLGLLRRDGSEALQGRIIVAEVRCSQPVWMLGRSLSAEHSPKYLGVKLPRPLLGVEAVRGQETVLLVEGVFDLLTAREWGYPALATCGTFAHPVLLRAALAEAQRVCIVEDNDQAGREAARRYADLLGPNAVILSPPNGAKDLNELACQPDGSVAFRQALRELLGPHSGAGRSNTP